MHRGFLACFFKHKSFVKFFIKFQSFAENGTSEAVRHQGRFLETLDESGLRFQREEK